MASKKVAIMTWYKYLNYGTALQASALYKTVEALGYEPKMINYIPKGAPATKIEYPKQYFFKKAVSVLKNQLNKPYSDVKREQLFAEFLSARVTETGECSLYSELQELEDHFDAFLCGSDQIWSPLCYDPHYFLDFVHDTGKMIAYAPSIGSNEIKDADIKGKMEGLLSRFRHLSIREQKGAEIIRELTGKETVHVLDPTLLLNSAEWDEFADVEVPPIKEEYIFCYFLGDAAKYRKYISTLSKKLGLPAYLVPVTQKQSASSFPFEVGPKEFVSLIKNAKYVCTDSFHGMAFSIQYNVPFTVFKRFKDNDPKNQNSRVLGLLNKLSLEERLIAPENTSGKEFEGCDFSKANETLQKEREFSMAYLKSSLCAATTEKKDSKDYIITGRCCGCGACAAVCKTGAVSIHLSDEGFYHYTINQEKCVHCGQCKSVCPFTETKQASLRNAKGLYSYKSNLQETLRHSSSGGFAYDAAVRFMAQGRYLCGCVYDQNSDAAKHIILAPHQEKELFRMQGSKYIQSQTNDIFEEFCTLSKQHKTVFFGTPCQAAGLDRLLRKNNCRENVIIIDLICHGVPSNHLWKKYLEEQCEKYRLDSHPAVLFRDKCSGWRDRTLTIRSKEGNARSKENRDPFYAFFKHSLCDMETCYDCLYRETSCADIRIGDYWGNRFRNDSEGVSMVLAVTDSGKKALEELGSVGNFDCFDLSEYWTVQFPYNHEKPVFRETLLKKLLSKDASLSALRSEYCWVYEKREQISKMKRVVKELIGRG